MSIQAFKSQRSLVSHIEQYLQKLNQNYINNLLHQQYYQQTSSLIQSSAIYNNNHSQTLAKKILNLINNKDKQELSIFSQIQYRLKIVQDTNGNQLQEIISKYQKEKSQIKESGLKISQFREIYEEEMENLEDQTKLTKKMRTLFENDREDIGLDEFMDLFIKQIEKQMIQQPSNEKFRRQEDDEYNEQAIQEDIKFDLDKLVQQFSFISKIFTF